MASTIRPQAIEASSGAFVARDFCTGAALCIEACRAELARLHDAAPEAERSDGCARIHQSCRELAQHYAEVRLDDASE
jgi:hypothetical protein